MSAPPQGVPTDTAAHQVVFLDVNVPMYAAGQPHRYRDACIWILQEVADDRLAVAIDVEIVQEILYRFGALRRWDDAVRLSQNVLDLVPKVHSVESSDVHAAIDLFRRYAPLGVQARDVIHAAVMQHHGLTRIISTDQHFDHIEGLTRLDPVALYDAQRQTRQSEVGGLSS